MIILIVIGLWVYGQGAMSQKRALEVWKGQFQADWDLWWPLSYKVLRGNATGDNELTYWFLLEMPAQDIPGFKRDLMHRLRDAKIWRIDDCDSSEAFTLLSNWKPHWWHPEALSDVDALVIYSKSCTYHFFISRKTGRVYVYRWSQ